MSQLILFCEPFDIVLFIHRSQRQFYSISDRDRQFVVLVVSEKHSYSSSVAFRSLEFVRRHSASRTPPNRKNSNGDTSMEFFCSLTIILIFFRCRGGRPIDQNLPYCARRHLQMESQNLASLANTGPATTKREEKANIRFVGGGKPEVPQTKAVHHIRSNREDF